ncbi:hypothetical protein [Pseudomonas cichorii]|nr:hypothetical protein [Pseudomonas cichorii]
MEVINSSPASGSISIVSRSLRSGTIEYPLADIAVGSVSEKLHS